jgi:hypothetical protein
MRYNLRRIFGLISIIVIAALANGCAETTRPLASGKGAIRGIASIVDSPDGLFMIEERRVGPALFKGVAGFNFYDNLSYNFNFDIFLPGDIETTRLTTQFIDVVADMEYTVILTGTLDNPTTILWEDAQREWDDAETVFEPVFAHISPALGDVDVYFADVGTPPVLGNEIGSLTLGERLTNVDYPEGNYALILTAAGNPANILYTSGGIFGNARTRPLYGIFDADPTITAPVAVNIILEDGNSGRLPDANYPPQLRFYHAAFGTENVDVYLDDDFSAAVFSDVGFDELSIYADVQELAGTMTMTAVGNPGAIIFESNIIIAEGVRITLPMVGEPGALALTGVPNSARPIATASQIRIGHYGIGLEFVNLYMLEPGTEIELFTTPVFGALGPQSDSGFFEMPLGTYEMTLTKFGTLDVVAPKIIVDLAAGELVDFAVLNTVDPAIFEISLYDRAP